MSVRQFFFGFIVLLASFQVQAATFTVTKTQDTVDGTCNAEDCSLREAVIAANASSGEDVIVLEAGTYTLSIPGANEDNASTGDLDIKNNLIIVGTSGAAVTTVQWQEGRDRVFHMLKPAETAMTVKIKGITIRGGNTSTSLSKMGGGILASGSLILEDCIVKDNTSGDAGGGVNALHSLTVTRSSFSNNAATSGAAIYAPSDTSAQGSVLVQNSSFFNNTASNNGGAIYIAGRASESNIINTTFSKNTAAFSGGAVYNISPDTLRLLNLTISENTSTNGSALKTTRTMVFIGHSILANNSGDTACHGTFTSLGYNLIDKIDGDGIEEDDDDGDVCEMAATTGDQFNVSTANLSGLSDNGTAGNGHYPLGNGSSAINASPSSDCVRPDQINHSLLGLCDIGAIESTCGDGVVDSTESCDDGNVASGDGCSPQCGLTESDCDDNSDNDADGSTDCNDADCASSADCSPDTPQPESNCTDDLDNDGDTATDCDDSDCASDPACQQQPPPPTPNPETACTDGLDNDIDGTIDCNDTDCASNTACTGGQSETNCTDTLDNDGDTAIDCNDSDCANNAACLIERACSDLTDNDADGTTDCSDSDCASDTACVQQPSPTPTPTPTPTPEPSPTPTPEPAPSPSPAPTSESDCTDGSDDDNDGDTDCDDEDCAESLACTSNVSVESNCNDDLDDDSDGDTDCDDADCSDASDCTTSEPPPDPSPAPADSGGGGCQLIPL